MFARISTLPAMTISRFNWLFAFLSLSLLLLASSPAALAQGGPISYPPETEVVRGVIEIRGTAVHPEFWKYELAAAPFGTGNWFNLGVSETPVQNGVLGRWDTNTVPDGTYTLRLRIVRRDGNYDEFTVQRVLVGNAAPAATATPAESPTPTPTPTREPPTATPVVITPDIPTPTLAPLPTVTPLPGADGGDSGEPESGPSTAETLSSLAGRAAAAFVQGARLVLLVFLVVGVFFAVKHALTWLYYRFLVSR